MLCLVASTVFVAVDFFAPFDRAVTTYGGRGSYRQHHSRWSEFYPKPPLGCIVAVARIEGRSFHRRAEAVLRQLEAE